MANENISSEGVVRGGRGEDMWMGEGKGGVVECMDEGGGRGGEEGWMGGWVWLWRGPPDRR